MKKTLLGLMLTMLASISTAGIDKFDELKKELLNGNDLKAIINIDKCEGADKLKDDEKSCGFTVSSFYIKQSNAAESVIMANNSHYTVHHEFGPVNMIVSLKARDSKFVTVHASILDAKTYELKSDHTLECKYGKAIEFEKK